MCSTRISFIMNFIEELEKGLKEIAPGRGLSKTQKAWLNVCITGIVITNSICWKRFERVMLGHRSHASLSWMFRYTNILWHMLLRASVRVILWKYNIKWGILVEDDSDKKRSKTTGQGDFMTRASNIFGGKQVISQLRKDQKIRFRTKEMSVTSYFLKFSGTEEKIKIRGDKEVDAFVGSARLHVCAHKKKQFVIALKYKGEEEYRYLVASELSWRTLDIAQSYTLRWLVEVFFQDWKSYEGWGQLTKQPDEEGSRRGLILSLLVDHCLLLHPGKLARLENKLPACTVGSLQEKIKAESLHEVIQDVISSEGAEGILKRLTKAVKEMFPLASSKKHMMNRDLGHMEPTLSLKYRGAYCLT